MTRPPLVCNCTRYLARQGRLIPVRGWRWDCPSCGLDKRRAVIAAGEAADARRILTLTFPQPRATGWDGMPIWPQGFEQCRWDSHAYRYRDGSYRWRVMPSCRHCSHRVTRMLVLWRKRLRRRGIPLQYLYVKEAHKSGALHLHVLVTGLPHVLSRSAGEAVQVKRHWAAVGGGFADVGRSNLARDGARQAAGYAAKYVTKAVNLTVARGCRRWSRTRGFGPEVQIPGPTKHSPHGRVNVPQVMIGGWVDPFSGSVVAQRVWDSKGREPVRLDPRSGNCPQTPSPAWSKWDVPTRLWPLAGSTA